MHIRKSEGVLLEVSGGRPHVIFNPTTHQYVLWHNLGTGYSIATSSAPSAPFTPVGTAALDPQFAALQPADESVNVIGMAYFKAWHSGTPSVRLLTFSSSHRGTRRT